MLLFLTEHIKGFKAGAYDTGRSRLISFLVVE